MRAAALLLLAVAGCSREPSFDERYDEQADNLANKADRLEADLRNQLDAAAAAGSANAEPAGAHPFNAAEAKRR